MSFARREILLVVPTAWFFFDPPPAAASQPMAQAGAPRAGARVLGLNANLVLLLLASASFLCCVTMAMPQSHLIAFCTDLGITPERGAAMLSVLLGTAFVSRQIWGW